MSRRSTDNIEMVETHNLYLALKRLRDGSHNGYDSARWKRALWHALEMEDCTDNYEMRKALREALKLP